MTIRRQSFSSFVVSQTFEHTIDRDFMIKMLKQYVQVQGGAARLLLLEMLRVLLKIWYLCLVIDDLEPQKRSSEEISDPNCGRLKKN